MSENYVMSIIYWWACAFLMIPMIYITIKSLMKSSGSRDIYSVMTLLFILLMLLLRALSLFPIIVHGDKFNEFDSQWEKAIFIATPISVFCLAVLIHSMRWFNLQYKLKWN